MIIPVHGDDMIDDDLYRHTTAPLLLRYAMRWASYEDVRRRPFVDRHAARRGIEINALGLCGMGWAGVRAGSNLLRADE